MIISRFCATNSTGAIAPDILDVTNIFTNESNFIDGSRQDAKGLLGVLGLHVGQGRKQAVPAHPALTAFAHPYTADAEALRLCERLKEFLICVSLKTGLTKC